MEAKAAWNEENIYLGAGETIKLRNIYSLSLRTFINLDKVANSEGKVCALASPLSTKVLELNRTMGTTYLSGVFLS